MKKIYIFFTILLLLFSNLLIASSQIEQNYLNFSVSPHFFTKNAQNILKIRQINKNLTYFKSEDCYLQAERLAEKTVRALELNLERQLTRAKTVIKRTHSAVNNIYLNGVRIAAVSSRGKTQYYLTDQVDSVKVIVDDKGEIINKFEYLPYGDTWITEGEGNNNPKYNSQELDRETSFYFYNARYYDPEICRFVTADNVVDGELSSVGWNRYAYVKGNPVRYRDVTGHLSYDVNGNNNQGQFIADKDDTWKSISKEAGIDVKELIEANKDSKGKAILSDGKNLNIPEKTNIKIFKAAASKIEDKDYAATAFLDFKFSNGKNKCNKFVYDMVEKKAGVDFPERKILDIIEHGPVTAGDLGNKNKKLEYTKIVPKEKAIIGDIIGYKIDNLNRATGHTVIYTGKVKIKKDGKEYKPEGGGGTIGAGTHKINYRSFKYLKDEEYDNPVFRRIIKKENPHYGHYDYGPAYAFP